MRAIPALLIVLLLGLLAGGLWLFLQSGEGAAARGGGLEIGPGADPAAPLSPDPLAVPDGHGKGEPEEAARRDAVTGVGGASAPGEAVRARSRSVTGRVVDELGRPVPGARVFHSRRRQNLAVRIDWPGTSSWLDVEQTLSDEAGEFSFDASGGGVSLAVRAEGFAPLRTDRELAPTGETRLADLVLERSVTLTGHVVDTAGRPIPGATIHEDPADEGGFRITFFGAGEELAATDAGGAFAIDQLGAGPFRLRIRHPDHPDLFVSEVADRPGQVLAERRFVMEDGFEISGQVLGIDPGERAGYRVRASATYGGSADPLADFAAARTAAIDAGGGFAVRGLRSGRTYRLNVIEAGANSAFFAESRSSAVHAVAGDTGVKLEMRDPFALTFAVVDAATGGPLTSFEVEAGKPWMEVLHDADGNTDHHPDGVVRFADVPVGAGQKSADVRIRAEGYETVFLEDVALEPGNERNLGIIRLERVPWVLVHVVDAETGEPIQGARVSLREVSENTFGGRSVALRLGGGEDEDLADLPSFGDEEESRGVTDKAGEAKLASLPGTRAQLRVRHRGYVEYAGDPVALPAALDVEFTAKLLRGGTVVVHVVDSAGSPVAGAAVDHRAPDEDAGMLVLGGGPSRKTRADGTATFAHLAPGTHRFSPGRSGESAILGGRMVIAGMGANEETQDGIDVLVGEGTHHEITLRQAPTGTVRGVVTENGQPLAGASVSFRPKREGEEAEIFVPGFSGDQAARADSRGRYAIEDLREGVYIAAISHPSRAMPAEFEVTVREGETTEDFALSVAILEGRVTDSEGKGVAGVEVVPERVSGEPERSMMMVSHVRMEGAGVGMSFTSGPGERASATTDTDGRYALRGVQPDVELRVETRAEDYQPGESEVVIVGAGQTRRGVDVEIHIAGAIALTVLRADGSIAPFCMANLDYLDEDQGEGAEARHEFIGESGRLKVAGLRPGRWRIGVTSVPMGGDEEEARAEPIEVVVVPGETVEVVSELP